MDPSMQLSLFARGRFGKLTTWLGTKTLGDWAKLSSTEAAERMPCDMKLMAAAFHQFLGSNHYFENPFEPYKFDEYKSSDSVESGEPDESDESDKSINRASDDAFDLPEITPKVYAT